MSSASSDKHLVALVEALTKKIKRVKELSTKQILAYQIPLKDFKRPINATNSNKKGPPVYMAQDLLKITKWTKHFEKQKQFQPLEKIKLATPESKKEKTSSPKVKKEAGLGVRTQAKGCNVDSNKFTFGSLGDFGPVPRGGRGARGGRGGRGGFRGGFTTPENDDATKVYRDKMDARKEIEEEEFEREKKFSETLADMYANIQNFQLQSPGTPRAPNSPKRKVPADTKLPEAKTFIRNFKREYGRDYLPIQYHMTMGVQRTQIIVDHKIWSQVDQNSYANMRFNTGNDWHKEINYGGIKRNERLFNKEYLTGILVPHRQIKKPLKTVDDFNNIRETPRYGSWMDYGYITDIKLYSSKKPIAAVLEPNFKFHKQAIYEQLWQEDYTKRVEEAYPTDLKTLTLYKKNELNIVKSDIKKAEEQKRHRDRDPDKKDKDSRDRSSGRDKSRDRNPFMRDVPGNNDHNRHINEKERTKLVEKEGILTTQIKQAEAAMQEFVGLMHDLRRAQDRDKRKNSEESRRNLEAKRLAIYNHSLEKTHKPQNFYSASTKQEGAKTSQQENVPKYDSAKNLNIQLIEEKRQEWEDFQNSPDSKRDESGELLVDGIFYHENEIIKWSFGDKKIRRVERKANGALLDGCKVKFRVVLSVNQKKCEAVDVEIIKGPKIDDPEQKEEFGN